MFLSRIRAQECAVSETLNSLIIKITAATNVIFIQKSKYLVIKVFLKFLSYAALMANEARNEQSDTIVCEKNNQRSSSKK